MFLPFVLYSPLPPLSTYLHGCISASPLASMKPPPPTLQDSLGGNAKTTIIANVSPSALCAAETVSTLQFVSRAKCIKTRATINLNYRGDVAQLQRELSRLNTELDNLRRGFTDPAVQENKELRGRVDRWDLGGDRGVEGGVRGERQSRRQHRRAPHAAVPSSVPLA